MELDSVCDIRIQALTLLVVMHFGGKLHDSYDAGYLLITQEDYAGIICKLMIWGTCMRARVHVSPFSDMSHVYAFSPYFSIFSIPIHYLAPCSCLYPHSKRFTVFFYSWYSSLDPTGTKQTVHFI